MEFQSFRASVAQHINMFGSANLGKLVWSFSSPSLITCMISHRKTWPFGDDSDHTDNLLWNWNRRWSGFFAMWDKITVSLVTSHRQLVGFLQSSRRGRVSWKSPIWSTVALLIRNRENPADSEFFDQWKGVDAVPVRTGHQAFLSHRLKSLSLYTPGQTVQLPRSLPSLSISSVRGHMLHYSNNWVICETGGNWNVFTFTVLSALHGWNKHFIHACAHKAINTVLFIAENRPAAAMKRHLLLFFFTGASLPACSNSVIHLIVLAVRQEDLTMIRLNVHSTY